MNIHETGIIIIKEENYLDMQACQLSSISHETHANMLFLMLTREVIKISRK